MTSDYRHRVDTDPLRAIRIELVAAANRRLKARRRLRRATTIAASLFGILTVAGGAMAVSNVTTGVPAIDRLLQSVSDDSADSTTGRSSPSKPNYEPLPGGVTPPVEVHLGEAKAAVAIGYQSQHGTLCTALAEDRTAPPGEPKGTGGCLRRALLAKALRESPVRIVGVSGIGASSLLVHGFARGEVEAMGLTPRSGQIAAALTDAWTPPRWQGDPLRAFFAVVDGDAAGVTDKQHFPTLTYEVRLANGDVVTGDLRGSP